VKKSNQRLVDVRGKTVGEARVRAEAATLPAGVVEELRRQRETALLAMAPAGGSSDQASAADAWLDWIANQKLARLAELVGAGILTSDEVRTAVIKYSDWWDESDLLDMMRRRWLETAEVRALLQARVAAESTTRAERAGR
jgi:hypothetical protein